MWGISADLNSPLSSKLPDQHASTIYRDELNIDGGKHVLAIVLACF